MMNAKITALISLVALLLLVLACALVSVIDPTDPRMANIAMRLCPPSSENWLGCDMDGRDVLLLILYGGRISLFIASLSVLTSTSVGAVIGTLSGYFGGWFDLICMRIVDGVLSIPTLLIALVFVSVLGPSHFNIILILVLTGWAASARLVRAQVLSLKEREYVRAAEVYGASTTRIFIKHLLPQTINPLVIHATFSAAGVIIVESSLSFLGLSTSADIPTWGGLLNQGKSVMFEAPHLSIFPGLMIMFFVLSLNFLGDGLRDYLDPRMLKK